MRVFVHIGPPKTGTSAIQHWMSLNRSLLIGMGIYYPCHSTDKNGISSGNLESIFDREKDGTLIFSQSKTRTLFAEAEKIGVHTIVLSSEFFFKSIEPIIQYIPQAKFILYLRYDLEVVESSYNQSVKRHYKTDKFPEKAIFTASNLQRIDGYLSDYGLDKFLIRYYGKPLFYKNNIVADFISIFVDKDSVDIICEKYIQEKSINHSYSIECIEFKRWFNQFHLPLLHRNLDQFIQRKSIECDNYSLMSKAYFNDYKERCLSWTMQFVDKHKLAGAEEFIKHCIKYEQPRTVQQKLDAETFQEVLNEWLKENVEVYEHLEELLSYPSDSLENLENVDIIKRTLRKHSLLIRPISKFIKRIREFSKRLFN